jgi:hypothetical protein
MHPLLKFAVTLDVLTVMVRILDVKHPIFRKNWIRYYIYFVMTTENMGADLYGIEGYFMDYKDVGSQFLDL